MPGYVAIRVVFMVFFEMDFILYITHVFSKAVVDLSRSFADVKGFTFGTDNAVSNTEWEISPPP